jgi:PAS domain S-box-containing protein
MADDVAPLARAALDTLPITLAVLDGEGTILWTDRAWREFAVENDVRTDPDSVGENYLAVTEDSDDEFAREAADGLRRLLDGDCEVFTLEYPCHSPTEQRWFLMWAAPFETDGQRYVTVAHFDITERRLRERELEAASKKLDAVFQSSPEAIVVTDVDGEVQLWNDGAVETFGWTETAVVGDPIPFVPDDRRAAYASIRRRVLDGEDVSGYETVAVTESGERIDVSLSAAPVRDADGEVVASMGVVRDITDQKRRERELQHKSDELAALNRVVRHDIRNDMQVILAWTEVLAEHVDDEGEAVVEKILTSGTRVVELTEAARDLVDAIVEGETDAETEAVALRSVLPSEVEKAQELYPKATIEVAEVPPVFVDAGRLLSSVFKNLLNNAVQHNDGDDPTVSVSVETTDETVTVAVADDGPGVPDDHKETIFGKGEKGLDSQGTGVGLYLVKTLVDGYGGHVAVHDNDPRGTVFVVELPRADRQGVEDRAEGKV